MDMVRFVWTDDLSLTPTRSIARHHLHNWMRTLVLDFAHGIVWDDELERVVRLVQGHVQCPITRYINRFQSTALRPTFKRYHVFLSLTGSLSYFSTNPRTHLQLVCAGGDNRWVINFNVQFTLR